MCNMSRPPSGRDEYVILIDFQRRRSVEGISRLDTLKQPLESLESLELLLPKRRQVFAAINYNDAHIQCSPGQLLCKIEFSDVAPKHVFNVNRRNQKVNALWSSI